MHTTWLHSKPLKQLFRFSFLNKWKWIKVLTKIDIFKMNSHIYSLLSSILFVLLQKNGSRTDHSIRVIKQNLNFVFHLRILMIFAYLSSFYTIKLNICLCCKLGAYSYHQQMTATYIPVYEKITI